MKNSKMRLIKILSLIGMLALCLLLTGCVVPPEDVNANGGYVVTDGDLPFQSLNPTITGTPYTPPTSTPVPTSTPTQYPPVYATATPTSSPLPGVTPVQSTPQIIIGISTPTPQADATTTLKKGSSGKEVERMQQRLKELGYLKGSVDGDFGDATEAAVEAFQAQNGLTVDGKAGPATLAKLYSSSARRAPTTVVTNTPRATSTPFTSYKKGDSGPEIKRMQQRLKDLGYLKGSADGDFGDATEAAVRAFQANNGLTVDGKAGSATLNKLYSSSAKRAPSDPTRTPKPTATPTPRATATPRAESLDYYLQLGSSGTRVRTLQNRLIQLGWLEGTADGKYGPATEYAVKAFQDRYSSLWKDGIAGPDTLKLLYGAGAASAKTPASSLGMTLEPGDNGPAVTAMQKRLKELGYYKSSADGDFGNVTKSAVIAFQKANGLTADGRATTATLNKLYSADARDASYYEDDANARDEEDTDYDNDDPVAPEDSGDVTVGGYTTLRWGDTGPEVKKLQQALKNRGYYSGKLDSTFGSGVYAGVKAFQKQYGLKVDGIAGPATQMLLYNSSAPSSDTNTSLQKGSSGTKVRNLQYVLYELGYYDGPISGQYDTATVNAVRSFQSSNGLTPVDGVAGPKTLRVLYSGNAVPASAASSSSHDTLSKGSKGTAVVELQESLYNLGYLSEVTGEYDNATVEAVKNFQRRNGLSATGKADNETQRVLYSGSAKPAW
ncbi:MAG: peptidoglycan-binding protein [Clostridia bacterium]|nr:peptidoglycan-binding protein [Clostridia bacterium]